MSNQTYNLCNRLKKDLVIDGKNEVILADTAVKLQSKLHQLYSGTIKPLQLYRQKELIKLGFKSIILKQTK